ncbi:uncharacterized protein [Triticum aestivum]|uniref:uncharacterized protein isoform X2 n=1 Tax=Triticum aestivum TaxID=4565 RepID=UPI001D028D3C|nr:uncharacterized protein LOC123108164 isoform X2 [Triticum aestivum]
MSPFQTSTSAISHRCYRGQTSRDHRAYPKRTPVSPSICLYDVFHHPLLPVHEEPTARSSLLNPFKVTRNLLRMAPCNARRILIRIRWQVSEDRVVASLVARYIGARM